MPLRYTVLPFVSTPTRMRQCLSYAPFLFLVAAANPSQRPFHGTACRQDDQIDNSQNHYETLKLNPGATPVEIKKSFYALSKTHHPDHNPTSPHASRRFMRISEAYSILSIPAKRSAYDRDVLRLSSHPHASHALHHRGSYSSTNPAGGRAPSGLSRRRGTFQGPPPSFFRSGGWGSQGAKRRAAHEGSAGNGTSTGRPGHDPSSSSSTTSRADVNGSSNGTEVGGGAGGMGPGQTPFRDPSAREVPHFDRASHERTGRHSDRRRATRQAAAQPYGQTGVGVGDVEPQRGMAGMFFVIGGVLVLSVLGPFVISLMWGSSPVDSKQEERRGKKSASKTTS
ncbi:DnaJ-domain-containing protein [Hypoxylon sp. NC1633]|nr:DnaJ-domain-containing protein [Hypoxylon sp. NC1633]